MTDEEPDGKMDEIEFIRAKFFSSEAEAEASRWTVPDEIEALERFTKALDRMPQEARVAAIAWLADRFLGRLLR